MRLKLEEEKSLLSIKREEERNSPKMIEFKNNINQFIQSTNASPEIIYHLKHDLGIMTNMPYYKDYKGVKNRMDRKDIILNYCKLLIDYNNKNFTNKLINILSRNQNQNIRKLSTRNKNERQRCKSIGSKNGIWEHPITIKYIKDKLIQYINEKDIQKISDFLDFLINDTNQIFLTHDEDNLVNSKYRSNMPNNWDWVTSNKYQRYIDTNIRKDLYNKGE